MRPLKIATVLIFIGISTACCLLSLSDRTAKSDNDDKSFAFHAVSLRPAAPDTVHGNFDRDNRLKFYGAEAEMTRDGDDFLMKITSPNGSNSYKIKAVTGTKRIEEYVAHDGEKSIRLPVAYDLETKRWFGINAAVFEPENDDPYRHQTDWNANCASCHLDRDAANLADIQHSKLDSDTSLLVCATCHAKGLEINFPEIDQIASPGFPSGVVVAGHKSEALDAATTFADGSIRLAAHEYQGIFRSLCYQKSKAAGHGVTGEKISCVSCHSGKNGMMSPMTEEKIQNFSACTDCHQQFSTPESVAEHTKHEAVTVGSSCYNCHMPEVVYGHMRFQRTHEINVPNPELTALKSVPNACNLCHLDKSVNWAVEKSRLMWPERFRLSHVSKDSQFDQPEALRGLFAGDAFTRGLTANALAKHADPSWFAPFAIEAFQNEDYPLVRYFLSNALAADSNFPDMDYRVLKKKGVDVWSRFFPQIRPKQRTQIEATADALRRKRPLHEPVIAE